MVTQGKKTQRPPTNIRPLLWSLKWSDLDIQADQDDIILNVVNEGTVQQLRWLVTTYGKARIRKVLQRHWASELHPESRNLAKVMFPTLRFHHAPQRAH